MAKYRIEIKKSAVKEIKQLPAPDLKRVLIRIEELAEQPRPNDCQKLSHQEKYRVRVGDYRILYTIEDGVLLVLVVKIGHRKDVYRHQ